jgi:hypothetical protein
VKAVVEVEHNNENIPTFLMLNAIYLNDLVDIFVSTTVSTISRKSLWIFDYLFCFVDCLMFDDDDVLRC